MADLVGYILIIVLELSNYLLPLFYSVHFPPVGVVFTSWRQRYTLTKCMPYVDIIARTAIHVCIYVGMYDGASNCDGHIIIT